MRFFKWLAGEDVAYFLVGFHTVFAAISLFAEPWASVVHSCCALLHVIRVKWPEIWTPHD